MRITIDLTREQITRLKLISDRDGISRAEAIRRAVDTAYVGVQSEDIRQAREAAFGLWKGRNIDALQYVDNLRDEWEDRPHSARA